MSITRINSLGITDGTIVNGDINASAGIKLAKLSGVNDAKAWVNFDGTGTVAIRASFNVTSITDNGTGDYTVNITTAMPDVNYSTVITYSQNYGVARCVGAQINQNNSGTEVAPTTSAIRFVTTEVTANYDAKYVLVSIFR